MQAGIQATNAYLAAAASVVGQKEREGPLGSAFDQYDESGTDRFGQPTWEKAESEMQRRALGAALEKAALQPEDLELLFAGDLLNQCVGSAYGLLDFDVPYCGLYGACSTAAEGLLLASLLVSGPYARCGVVTSSHYCSAERQYRTPIEYGIKGAFRKIDLHKLAGRSFDQQIHAECAGKLTCVFLVGKIPRKR
jgi:stage V sporulation protein AD